MICNFVVGQKVAATCDFEHGFVKGQVATISGIEAGKYLTHDGIRECVCLTFKEVAPLPHSAGFAARYFRPVITRETNMKMFRSLLNPSKSSQHA